MCGIAGFIDRANKVSAEALAAASRAIAHRGPDDAGVQTLRMKDGGCVGLASRRLAILDLSAAGHQPMLDPDTGNWIAYNGEIYNFRELRDQLERNGARFASHTDTEVVLKAYAAWGEACLDRFRGMFAFAIWDAARQRLFLARDRLGKKPLYYYQREGFLLFASEVRALLATGLVPRRIHQPAVEAFLDFGSVSDPETLIEGVQALPPASYMTWQDSRSEVREYWDPAGLAANGAQPEDEAAILSRLRPLLHEAINLRMVSDVPVGVFLSGGIDSSSLVAALSDGTRGKINTFSVIFKDAEYNEARFSSMIARRFQTEHTEIDLTGDDFLAGVPDALAAMDQPSVDGCNTFVVSREVRRAGLKVALSGLGSDEIFAGYTSFRNVPLMERFLGWRPWMPSPLRAALSAAVLLRNSDPRRKLAALVAGNGAIGHPYFLARALFLPSQRKQLLCRQLEPPAAENSTARLVARVRNLDPVNRVSYLELRHYMANTLMRDTDCMSMAHGLEVRAPFLDHRLVEYALSIPGKLKFRRHAPKHLLVKAMEGQLPDEIVYRPKRGFTLPFEHWLRGALRPSVESVLTKLGDGPLGSVLQAEAVRGVWQSFLEGNTSWARPWSLYVLDRWCERNLGAGSGAVETMIEPAGRVAAPAARAAR